MRILITLCAVLATLLSFGVGNAQPRPIGDESQDVLLGTLQSDADLFDKAKACQKLAVIGDATAVKALADLLDHPQLSPYALTALQRIPSESVDKTLLESLARLQGRDLIGVIQVMGQRSNPQSTDALTKLASSKSSDADTRRAAIHALGKLAAAEALEQIQVDANDQQTNRVLADARLRALPVTKTPRQQAIEGLTASLKSKSQDGFRVAIQTARSFGPSAAPAIVDMIGQLSPERQIVSLICLSDLGDRDFADDVAALIDSDNLEIAMQAIDTAAELGYFDSQKTLPEWFDRRPKIVVSGLRSLAKANNTALDADVVQRLEDASGSGAEAEQILGLIDYAGLRRLSGATEALIELSRSNDQRVAREAIRAAGYTVTGEQFGVLIVRLLERPPGVVTQEDIDTCMVRACVQQPQGQASQQISDSLPSASNEDKIWLMSYLPQIGGETALEVATAAAKGDDEALVDGATRALGAWLSTDVANPLLDLAKTLTSGKYHLRALRAYLRVGRQFDMPVDERMKLCREGLRLADRDDERILVLEIIRRNPTVDGAELLAEMISDQNASRTLRNRSFGVLASVSESLAHSNVDRLGNVLESVDLSAAPDSVRKSLQQLAELYSE